MRRDKNDFKRAKIIKMANNEGTRSRKDSNGSFAKLLINSA